jgi:hypothetical protein
MPLRTNGAISAKDPIGPRPKNHFERRVTVVTLRSASALALLVLTSCGPTIQQSTTRAEIAAASAERSAEDAERAATLASRAAAQATKPADEVDEHLRRANEAVNRLEAPSVVRGDLLVAPTAGLPIRWCLMGPPILQGCPDCSESIEWHAPRSSFWVGDIFESKRDCHTALRKFRRQILRSGGEGLPFRNFCAACANDADEDGD